MTEKRFTFVDLGETWAISVDNECKYYMHLVDDCTTVVELLNKLSEENEHLKQEVNSLMEDLGYIDAELEELEDINKNVVE